MSLITFDTHHLKAGTWSGLVAGVVFGGLLGMMGVFPMIASLIGSTSTLVGVAVHLIISAIIGAIFSLFFGHEAMKLGKGIIAGLIYGLGWWFLGPLLIMPIGLGMGAQLSLTGMQAALPSLGGHLVFGFILGLVYQRLSQMPRMAGSEEAQVEAVE